LLANTERRANERVFLATSVITFIVTAGVTIFWCRSMSGGMPMTHGWTMSMAWMRMSEQTWLGASVSFMGMWVVMMVAMMLPALVPMLLRYRRAVLAPDARLGGLSAFVSAGYFSVWTACGLVAYSIGIVLAAAEMRWPVVASSVPIATGVVVLLAGCVQLSAWKGRQLAHCRDGLTCGGSIRPDAASALRYGFTLGVHCVLCCSSFMVVLLVTGVMSLSGMALVGAAITLERISPERRRTAPAIGIVVIAVGVVMIVRALSAPSGIALLELEAPR